MALALKKVLREPIGELVSATANVLKNNGVVAIPTDTIYGLAGLAQSKEAVDKIYNIKSRDYRKPLSICVSDVDDLKKWGKVTVPQLLLNELLPGPVTLLFERTASLNPVLNPEVGLVGIRIPDHAFVRALARSCGEPLALTSANESTCPSTLCPEEFSSLWERVDLVVDGGKISSREEARAGSTVVDLSRQGR